jgi:hypothetical protein
MKKVKLIRDYGGNKKDSVISVNDQQAYFLLTNSIAVVSDCGSDCEECEDCKSTKKKRTTVKKTVKAKKAPAKK